MTTQQLEFGRPPSNKPQTLFDWTVKSFRFIEQVSATWLQIIDGYVDITEIADPAAPAANTARLYVRDNGGGKTQLVVRFPTGAVQVIATEP